MPNLYGVAEVSVEEVAAKRVRGDAFVLLDVREPTELNLANLGDDVCSVPLTQLAAKQLDALPAEMISNKDAEVVVFCHHGARSAQVVAWLNQQGWTNVYNMDGGINAYAYRVDSSVGFY